jgi:hypothetical protein
MESLAWLVTAMLFVLLLMVVSTLVLSLLARLGKVPPVIGYVALGIQAVATIFSFLMSPVLLLPAAMVLAGCVLLLFLPKSTQK